MLCPIKAGLLLQVANIGLNALLYGDGQGNGVFVIEKTVV